MSNPDEPLNLDDEPLEVERVEPREAELTASDQGPPLETSGGNQKLPTPGDPANRYMGAGPDWNSPARRYMGSENGPGDRNNEKSSK